MRAIMTFHSVDDSASVLSVSPTQLLGVTRAIRRSGHKIVPLGELLDDANEANCIAFTFDDGLASVSKVAAPMLRSEGVRATLFLTTGYVGRNNAWPTQPDSAPRFPLMSWNDVESVHGEGWEIESHSRSHPYLTSLSSADLEQEIEGAKEDIERRLGRTPQAFAYPYGAFNQRVIDVVRRNYRYAVTVRMAVLGGTLAMPHLIPRLDAFYLRSPRVHMRFDRPGFSAFLSLRALLRRIRHYPAAS